MGYKVDEMVPTAWIGAAAKEKRNLIFLYGLHKS